MITFRLPDDDDAALDQLEQDIRWLLKAEEAEDEWLINYAHEALMHLGIPTC